MKIPKKTTGRHKLRDTKICMLWARELVSSEEISEKFKLSIRRIQQIVYANRDFLKLENEWEKAKRVRWYKQQIKKRGDSKKDSADLQEQLRKEIEGNGPLVDNSIHITQITNEEKVERSNRLKNIFSDSIG